MPMTVAAMTNATTASGPTSRSSDGVGEAQWEGGLCWGVHESELK